MVFVHSIDLLNDVLREGGSLEVCNTLQRKTHWPLQPPINKWKTQGRGRKGEVGETLQRVINKSLISWVFSPPLSSPIPLCKQEHTHTWTLIHSLTHTRTHTSSCLQVWSHYIDWDWEETDLLQRRLVCQTWWQQSSSPRAKSEWRHQLTHR